MNLVDNDKTDLVKTVIHNQGVKESVGLLYSADKQGVLVSSFYRRKPKRVNVS